MAVAAALGVGGDLGGTGGSPASASTVATAAAPSAGPMGMSNRLQAKMAARRVDSTSSSTSKMLRQAHPHLPPHPHHPQAGQLGDINRSIEKMSLGNSNQMTPGGGNSSYASTKNQLAAANRGGTSGMVASLRRDSNWTNSTEGYGSMRSSDQSMISRRASDVSAMSQGSNFSTTAMRNSPWGGGEMNSSAPSSRRSSLATEGQQQQQLQPHQAGASGANPRTLSQQLSRLHQKAESIIQSPMASQDLSVRPHSVMSDCSMPAAAGSSVLSGNGQQQHHQQQQLCLQQQQQQQQVQQLHHQAQQQQQQMMQHGGTAAVTHGAPRRASDPVGTMDRNFGVGGQMSRHRSYTNLSNSQQQVPLHGQQVRGMENGGYQSGGHHHRSMQSGIDQVIRLIMKNITS